MPPNRPPGWKPETQAPTVGGKHRRASPDKPLAAPTAQPVGWLTVFLGRKRWRLKVRRVTVKGRTDREFWRIKGSNGDLILSNDRPERAKAPYSWRVEGRFVRDEAFLQQLILNLERYMQAVPEGEW